MFKTRAVLNCVWMICRAAVLKAQREYELNKALMRHYSVEFTVDPMLLLDHCPGIGHQLLTTGSTPDIEQCFAEASYKLMKAITGDTEMYPEFVRATVRVAFIPSFRFFVVLIWRCLRLNTM
eukprot:jgi/Hompol1/3779/HPOL_003350-RA